MGTGVESGAKAPKVSVVIPVYNTEDYLREALRSILDQTLRDIEVVVADDGSTDNSAAIIREEAEKDSRLRLISKANGGQSSARNAAMEIVTGEYVYFMDSDDILEPDALERCYAESAKEDLDVLFFNGDIFGHVTGLFDPDYYKRTEGLEEKVYLGIDILNILMSGRQFRPPVWLHFFKRTFLERIAVRFYNGIIHEDELYTALCYLRADRVGFVPDVFFHRRLRDSSTMTTSFGMRNMTGYFTVSEQLRLFAENKDRHTQKTVHRFVSLMLNAAVLRASVLPWGERKAVAQRSCGDFRAYVKPAVVAKLLLKKPVKKLMGRR